MSRNADAVRDACRLRHSDLRPGSGRSSRDQGPSPGTPLSGAGEVGGDDGPPRVTPSAMPSGEREKGNSATRPPDKRQTLLRLARRRAAVTLDGAALFVIDANCHGPPCCVSGRCFFSSKLLEGFAACIIGIWIS